MRPRASQFGLLAWLTISMNGTNAKKDGPWIPRAPSARGAGGKRYGRLLRRGMGFRQLPFETAPTRSLHTDLTIAMAQCSRESARGPKTRPTYFRVSAAIDFKDESCSSS